ncbi:UTP--glucose-1-phosphate uridylyltransferase GalU [Taurinivorans muris]|uniref:UTP--glucose-1-phosphate uridylyltransferase n=1 Tax=Taurinivorans muris TaxID=2787751 RepID=A0ABY5Y2P0_9BACT|nr:UTP--glucose-1-phosphate uridylyltransferase GalU [Desulfovibrionaceae bacterium LT0009]
MKNIRKVVIPVAGHGTRSLPASKNVPKEMLPIYNKPVIHYVVDEAVNAGIENVVFVTSKEKTALEDYFDHHYALEDVLERTGKKELLKTVQELAHYVNVISVRQKCQLGFGHAVLTAKPVVGNEPFGVMVGDDILLGKDCGLKELIDIAEKENKPVIGVMEVDPSMVCKYGIVAGNKRPDGIIEITDMVEKPKVGEAPSNMAIIGRYVLPPEIFDYLENAKPGHGGEIQLTDALNLLAKERGMLAVPVKGRRFDAGDLLDFLSVNMYFALHDGNMKDAMKKRLQSLLQEFE